MKTYWRFSVATTRLHLDISDENTAAQPALVLLACLAQCVEEEREAPPSTYTALCPEEFR